MYKNILSDREYAKTPFRYAGGAMNLTCTLTNFMVMLFRYILYKFKTIVIIIDNYNNTISI